MGFVMGCDGWFTNLDRPKKVTFYCHTCSGEVNLESPLSEHSDCEDSGKLAVDIEIEDYEER